MYKIILGFYRIFAPAQQKVIFAFGYARVVYSSIPKQSIDSKIICNHYFKFMFTEMPTISGNMLPDLSCCNVTPQHGPMWGFVLVALQCPRSPGRLYPPGVGVTGKQIHYISPLGPYWCTVQTENTMRKYECAKCPTPRAANSWEIPTLPNVGGGGRDNDRCIKMHKTSERVNMLQNF